MRICEREVNAEYQIENYERIDVSKTEKIEKATTTIPNIDNENFIPYYMISKRDEKERF